MRIRNFKWSTDVFGPAVGILLVIWGILADGPTIAVFGGYLFIIMALYLLGRAERVQSDGSYGALVSQEWYGWIDPTKIVVALVAGTLIVSVTLFLLGLSLYLAILAGGGLTICWLLLIVLIRHIRQQ